jgi:hypothetical protein
MGLLIHCYSLYYSIYVVLEVNIYTFMFHQYEICQYCISVAGEKQLISLNQIRFPICRYVVYIVLLLFGVFYLHQYIELKHFF